MSDESTQDEEIVPGVPTEGWPVLHLFYHLGPELNSDAAVKALESASGGGYQVVTAALIGHKADFAVMVLGPDVLRLRKLQSELWSCGLILADSYFSLTEVSEYARNLPEERRLPRLYPVLPPEGKRAFCFYPMSKRRDVGANWYMLSYEDRMKHMAAHGASGHKFAGRIIQLITGSTGLDAYEWGVTLFGQRIDDIKDVVYTLRFDEVSAEYAEFGPFYVGIVDRPEVALNYCMANFG
ncbi:MAG: chlorite dismutase [Actinomycetota bacterium]|nr:MAG: chlorite dismutase [Actinomycetota bacterium]